jgi:membrane-associated PAP2 superfamily phosphatase
MIASASAMRSLKDVTGIYCPVQLKEYGGFIVLHAKIQLGHLMIINEGSGRCWPAGHATAGFAWLAIFFAFHQMGRRRAAYTALVAALLYGHFLGIVQVIRGQHFLSHQFYTMAFCWLIDLFLFSLWRTGLRLAQRLRTRP